MIKIFSLIEDMRNHKTSNLQKNNIFVIKGNCKETTKINFENNVGYDGPNRS